MATYRNQSTNYIGYSILCFFLVISASLFSGYSFSHASLHKWGTVQVDSSTPELTEGQYDIYLQFNGNPPVTIGNFSPVISQDTLPNLDSIYLYHQIRQLTASANSIDIMMNAEGFAYVYNRDAYNRVFLLALGADILDNYSFYDPNLNRNILYYSLSARDTTFLDHRFSYYLSVIREMVYQNTITRANTIGPELNRLAEAIGFVKHIYGLTEKADLVYKLVNRYAPDTAAILQAIDESNSDSILAIMQNDISDKSLDDLQQGVNYILEKLNSTDIPHKYLKVARNLDGLTKAIDALNQINALVTAAPLTIDVILAWFTFQQNLHIFTERFQALESFFISYRDMIMGIDPQIVFAFDHFKTNEFGNLGPYVFFNTITLDNFKNLISLTEYFITTLSPISPLLSLALWTAKDSLFELIEDINAANYTTASYTFLKVLQDYLRDKIESFGRSGSIIYEDASKILTSMQMFLAQSYSIDVTFREITCFNFSSPADWLIFFAFGGREVLDKVCTDSQYFENEAQRYLQIIGGKASFADVIHSDSHPFERPGNFTFIESKIKDKNIIAISLSLIQSTYQPNDTVTLSANLSDVLEAAINDALVAYNIKNDSNMVVRSGTLSPLGSGQYQSSFIVPDIPGNYTIEVSALKQGYKDGFDSIGFNVQLAPGQGHDVGVLDVSWSGTSSYDSYSGDLVVNPGETIKTEKMRIYNYGYYAEANVPVIMEIIDPSTNQTKASSNIVYLSSIQPSQMQETTSILSINTPNIPFGSYKVAVKTILGIDSNQLNDSVKWDIFVGTPQRPPEHIPEGSYYYYIVEQTSASNSLTTTVVGDNTYTITLTYYDANNGSLSISGACTGNWLIEKNKFYSKFNDVCSGNVFVTLQGLGQFSGQTYINLEVGVKSTNPNIQQNTRYRGVHKWGGTECDPRYVSLDTKATFDAYSQSGNMNASLIGYNLNPRSLIGAYIKTWTFSDKNSCGGYDASYGGRKFNSKNYSTTNKFPDDYVIVPSTGMPSGDHNFVIVHRLPDEQLTPSQKNPSSPQIVGYAHSIRLNVINRHDVSVGTIQLPLTMQSGSTYSIIVPVVNNGDVDESNVSVNLNISNGSGYNQPFIQSVSVNKGTTVNVPFIWNTLGLSQGTYYFTASAMIADDISPTNDTTSDQKNLLPPPSLSIAGSTNKTEYGEGETITLNISVKDDLQTPIPGVSVSYRIKKAGADVGTGVALDQGNGSYFDQFPAPYVPGSYSIEISASEIGYLSGLNNSLTFIVKDTIKPTIPILYSPGNDANISTTQMNFDWSDSVDSGSGVARYQIQVSMNTDFSTNIVDMQPVTSNYTVTLSPGTFYWRVRSIDNSGNESIWSNILKFMIDTESPSVQVTNPTSNPTYSTNQSMIDISGIASDNIAVTQVIWLNNSTGASGAATGTTSWSVNGVSLNTGENIITVTARDAASNTRADSLTVTYAPPDNPPSPPTGLKITGFVGGGIKLAWNANTEPDLEGYKVYYGKSPNNYESPIDVGNATTYDLTGLLTGQTYYIAITALDTLNNESNKSYEVSGSIYAGLIFHDDFEDYTAGSPPPSPWLSLLGGASTVTNSEYQSGIKSIVVSGGPSSCQSAVTDLGDNYPDKIGYEIWAKANSASSGAFVGFIEQIGSMAPQFNAVYFSENDGKVYFVSSDQNYPVSVKLLDSFATGVWHKVHVEIDFANLMADVYINDVLVGNHIPASPKNAAWNGNSFQLKKVGVMHYFGDPFYFDNFSVFSWTPRFMVDFDGDREIDITVWRPGDGYWYIIGSKDGGIISQQWGSGTLNDIPVPGDYDGDGVTDYAVYRPGYYSFWYILKSSDGEVIAEQWGTSGDVPVPGDYDGDGKTDIAVWRPGDGHWYIKGRVIALQQWGTGTLFPDPDIPVPGDYDGDRITDYAVWRPGEYVYWYIINSKDESITSQQWGSSSLNDAPVPGDYDGDGKTDIAVWRPADGYWHIISSKDGSIKSQQWGAGYPPYNDVPVPGDYDGDGKTDIAIWRPADGYWYIINSKDASIRATQWGAGYAPYNDKPISQKLNW